MLGKNFVLGIDYNEGCIFIYQRGAVCRRRRAANQSEGTGFMDQEMKKQFDLWHEADEYQKIVDAVLAIDEKERDYE